LYDEYTGEWAPKWGMRKNKKIELEDIIIEHKDGEKIDPNEDVFEARERDKKEKQKKQQEREERNLKRIYKTKTEKPTSLQAYSSSSFDSVPAPISYIASSTSSLSSLPPSLRKVVKYFILFITLI
jgi:hypothetical protein